jgi:hypothetical protein
VLTAAGGFVMLAKWISRGGLHQQHDATTRFPAGLVFGHLGLAAAGLLLWIAYLLLDNDRLAWIAFVTGMKDHGAAGLVDLIFAGGAGCGRSTVRPSGTGALGVKQGGQAGVARWAESPC